MKDNNFLKMFNRKNNSVENAKSLEIKKIDSFFKKKMSEFSSIDDKTKPYARGFNDVDFGEALRKLRYGDKEEALNILNELIKRATELNPDLPDIQEIQEIVKYIEEATNKDLMEIEGIKTEL